jgi:hypothetical protein
MNNNPVFLRSQVELPRQLLLLTTPICLAPYLANVFGCVPKLFVGVNHFLQIMDAGAFSA